MDATDVKTFKVSNGALASPSLPSRLKIFDWGDNKSTDGVFRAGSKTATNLPGNQKRLGFERVAIDFDHCTVPGHPTQKELLKNGQPPLVFGYGTVNVEEGKGIFLEDVTWTPLGMQHAKNFEDLSPALRDENGEVTMIHSVALTPNGKISGLQFFSATNQNMKTLKDTITGEDLASALGLPSTASVEDINKLLKLFSNLASFFVSEDGKVKSFSAGSIFAEMSNRLAKLEDGATKQIATLSATIGGKVHSFTAEDVVGVVSRLEKLENEIKAGRESQTAIERDLVVKSFAADGKVPKKADGTALTPEELRAMDIGTLRILSANTPVSVALSARHGAHSVEGTKNFRFKDIQGKEHVDLAALFNDENARAGHSLIPNI